MGIINVIDRCWTNSGGFAGAFKANAWTKNWSNWSVAGDGGVYNFSFSAHNYNEIYQENANVVPNSVKTRFYIKF